LVSFISLILTTAYWKNKMLTNVTYFFIFLKRLTYFIILNIELLIYKSQSPKSVMTFMIKEIHGTINFQLLDF